MEQENETEIKDEGVTVTTTPTLSLTASATAKLAASAETSTAFNIKTATSVVALDSFSFGVLGFKTSKNIGPSITYQCGKNATNFDTSHLNNSYVYTKDLTFSYVNGMALRGKTIEISNTTDIQNGAKAALVCMAVGSIAAPVVSFGVNLAGQNDNWETSAEKKNRKADEKLQKKKDDVEKLDNAIDEDEKQINELEKKKESGELTDEEQKYLDDLKKDVDEKQKERNSIQDDIDDTEKKNQEKSDTEEDIGGSPDKKTSQNIANISSAAGLGVSALASIASGIAAAKSIFGEGSADNGIFMTAQGDLVMNATGGTEFGPKFCVYSNDEPCIDETSISNKASLEISDAERKKQAAFRSISKFLAAVGNSSSMACTQDSVTFKTGNESSVKIAASAVELNVGNNCMKIETNSMAMNVDSFKVKVEQYQMSFPDVKIQKM